jgi:hypothetical protein
MKEVKKLSKKLKSEVESISDAMWDGLEQAQEILQV